MRALLVHPGPAYSVADVYHGWASGLTACGVQVAEFNLGDRLAFYCQARLERDGEYVHAFSDEEGARLATQAIEAACYRVWPDVVLIVSGFFIPPTTYQIMRARGHKVVLLHTESPYEDDAQLLRAPAADLNVLNDPTNLDAFQELAPSVYIPHGYDPAVHHPRPHNPEQASDFFFCGTGYPSRLDFLAQVDFSGVDAKFGGNWQEAVKRGMALELVHPPDECLDNIDAAGWYGSTKLSANLYRKEAATPDLSDGWAMGPREIELAACGTFYLREPRGEGDELLPMLPTFTSPDEFTEQMRWALAHDDEREDAALKAREAVADRTFARHAAELLRLLDL